MRSALLIVCLLVVACGGGSGTGGRCQTSAECQMGLVCLPAGEGRLCLRPCDYHPPDATPDQHLCSDGAACLAIEGMRVCYLGGTHPLESPCTLDTDCEPGTVCATDNGLCTQACTVGVDIPCDTNETCVPISGGICRAAMIVLDGGTLDGGT